MRLSAEMDVKVEEWGGAARSYSNLSELELTLGGVAGAVSNGELSVTYADRGSDDYARFMLQVCRSDHADALHQAGRRAEAEVLFRQAQALQAERQPAYPLIYSLSGFRYCDLLLTLGEHAAGQIMLQPETRNSELETAAASCRAVSERAAQTLKWQAGMRGASLLEIALDHLTLGRSALYAAVLEDRNGTLRVGSRQRGYPSSGEFATACRELDTAMGGLRRASAQEFIVRGLLTRAWLRFLSGAHIGSESAPGDLDEAWEIAERSPMRLFMADIHLYRARLFHGVKPYPWTSAHADLAAARKLIEQCGYWRRKEELEDAEAAAKDW
jgi:hypothetical protein